MRSLNSALRQLIREVILSEDFAKLNTAQKKPFHHPGKSKKVYDKEIKDRIARGQLANAQPIILDMDTKERINRHLYGYNKINQEIPIPLPLHNIKAYLYIVQPTDTADSIIKKFYEASPPRVVSDLDSINIPIPVDFTVKRRPSPAKNRRSIENTYLDAKKQLLPLWGRVLDSTDIKQMTNDTIYKISDKFILLPEYIHFSGSDPYVLMRMRPDIKAKMGTDLLPTTFKTPESLEVFLKKEHLKSYQNSSQSA